MENYLGLNSSIKLRDNSSEITFNSKIDNLCIGNYVVIPVKTETTNDNYYFKITEMFKQDNLYTKVTASEVGNFIINNIWGVNELWGKEIFLIIDPNTISELQQNI